jgi:hypothetical protein
MVALARKHRSCENVSNSSLGCGGDQSNWLTYNVGGQKIGLSPSRFLDCDSGRFPSRDPLGNYLTSSSFAFRAIRAQYGGTVFSSELAMACMLLQVSAKSPMDAQLGLLEDSLLRLSRTEACTGDALAGTPATAEGFPSVLNRYAYANCDPVNSVDPSGLAILVLVPLIIITVLIIALIIFLLWLAVGGATWALWTAVVMVLTMIVVWVIVTLGLCCEDYGKRRSFVLAIETDRANGRKKGTITIKTLGNMKQDFNDVIQSGFSLEIQNDAVLEYECITHEGKDWVRWRLGVKSEATVEGQHKAARTWTKWQMYNPDKPTEEILDPGIDEKESDLPGADQSGVGAPTVRNGMRLTRRLSGGQGRWQREAERLLGLG